MPGNAQKKKKNGQKYSSPYLHHRIIRPSKRVHDFPAGSRPSRELRSDTLRSARIDATPRADSIPAAGRRLPSCLLSLPSSSPPLLHLQITSSVSWLRRPGHSSCPSPTPAHPTARTAAFSVGCSGSGIIGGPSPGRARAACLNHGAAVRDDLVGHDTGTPGALSPPFGKRRPRRLRLRGSRHRRSFLLLMRGGSPRSVDTG